ncbi:MAG: hypothetical protein AAGL98_16600, partial [Planctomycetota bacterium]
MAEHLDLLRKLLPASQLGHRIEGALHARVGGLRRFAGAAGLRRREQFSQQIEMLSQPRRTLGVG